MGRIDYGGALLRRWWVLVVLGVVGAIAGALLAPAHVKSANNEKWKTTALVGAGTRSRCSTGGRCRSQRGHRHRDEPDPLLRPRGFGSQRRRRRRRPARVRRPARIGDNGHRPRGQVRGSRCGEAERGGALPPAVGGLHERLRRSTRRLPEQPGQRPPEGGARRSPAARRCAAGSNDRGQSEPGARQPVGCCARPGPTALCDHGPVRLQRAATGFGRRRHQGGGVLERAPLGQIDGRPRGAGCWVRSSVRGSSC